MNSTAIAYEAALRPLSLILDAVPAEAWADPSPCTGWTARHVVAHLIDTQRNLLTDHGHDLGPTPDLIDPAAGFRDHAERVSTLITRDEVTDVAYDGFFGPTTVGATLEQFHVWDMLVHRWDIARATGGNDVISPEEMDRIEAGLTASAARCTWTASADRPYPSPRTPTGRPGSWVGSAASRRDRTSAALTRLDSDGIRHRAGERTRRRT